MERMWPRTTGGVHWTEDGERAICRRSIIAYWVSDTRRVNCPKCLAIEPDDGSDLAHLCEECFVRIEPGEGYATNGGHVCDDCAESPSAVGF